MAFSEKYCNALTGSNMNGGTDENSSPAYSATNGGWNSGTGVFTPTSGDPSAVSPTLVGQDAHVFADGSTTPTFIGRVTAVNSTTVTVSTTAKSGTAPGTAASGISINVGGVWKGPNGTSGFPFGFITSAQTNAAGDFYRVNYKNNSTYSITAGITHNVGGKGVHRGYSATAGDGGRATIDGGTSGASYVLLTVSGVLNRIEDFIFQNNGATGSAAGVVSSAIRNLFRRVVVNSVRGQGLSFTSESRAIECEAYTCNQSNSSSTGGINLAAAGCYARRCIAHDNTGAGFVVAEAVYIEKCVAESNAGHGANCTNANTAATICESDFYNNGSAGIFNNGTNRSVYIENCNLIKNGTYGIDNSAGGIVQAYNCGFGSGTQANTSGTTAGTVETSGSITYAADVTPWVDPANGDFRISLAAAKGTGRGAFTQTAASYAGTVAYPDVGASQHLESASGGGANPIGLGSPVVRGV